MRRDPRPRVILRAASGSATGMGHGMRCLAIALEVLELGGEALLVLDDPASCEAFAQRTNAHGGLEVVTATEAADWTRLPTRAVVLDGFRDWSDSIEELRVLRTPTLLVENRSAARPLADRVLYPALHHIDDAWDREHPERVLSGPQWIPLRPAIRREQEGITRDIDLLITFGGSDPNRLTERVLGALEGDARRVAVGVGSLMEDRRGPLEVLASRLPRAVLLETGGELAPWIARSLSAVTALGTTLYELAYHGVPAAILANHATDREALAWYANNNLHHPLGYHAEVGAHDLLSGLERLRRTGLCERPRSLGGGAARLAELLMAGLRG